MKAWGIRLVRTALIPILTFIATTGVTPPRVTGAGQGPPSTTPETLVVVVRGNPTFASRSADGLALPSGPDLPRRMFNAGFALYDQTATPQPYLLASLPELHSDKWLVFSDGRMEMTYRFRPGLTWHDGVAFTAADYVFSWQAYSKASVGQPQPPFDTIAEVIAPTSDTLVIRWLRPFIHAAHMAGREHQFPPLPRHLLENAATSSVNDFVSNRYWDDQYVGLGPYRLVRWNHATESIAAEAFPGHALGRPRIDAIQIQIVGDDNTRVARLLTGEAQILNDDSLAFEPALALRGAWETNGGGRVIWHYGVWRGVNFQHRPEYARPDAIGDVRVRKALAHAVDRDALNDAIYSGTRRPADFLLPVLGPWGEAAARDVVIYPYDPRASEQLMLDAGYERDAAGDYGSPGQGSLQMEIRTLPTPMNERELPMLTSGLRSAGFDVTPAVIPLAQARDAEALSTFTGLSVENAPVSEARLLALVPTEIPRQANRWRGGNRSGWISPEYTELVERFSSTLEAAGRKDQLTRMAHVFTNEAAALSLHFPPRFWALTSAVSGLGEVPPESDVGWNIHTWTLRKGGGTP